MKFANILSLLAVSGALLSACGGGETTQERATISGFSIPDRFGVINEGQQQVTRGTETIGAEGVAWSIGSQPGDGLSGFAGLIPGTSVAAPPAAGSATFSGTYEVGTVSDISLNDATGFISGRPGVERGTITLTADFDASTLTGASGGLTVNGALSGETLDGSVVFDGVEGDLTGLVGSDQAFGAFHGNNSTSIFAGGFATTRQ